LMYPFTWFLLILPQPITPARSLFAMSVRLAL
jgi:hypothetical protein